MLTILGDVYRIVTFQNSSPYGQKSPRADERARKRRAWHWIAGIHL